MFAHTFLFKKGIWRAEGVFTTANGTFQAQGDWDVSHLKDTWLIHHVIRVRCEDHPEYKNRYEIEPFKQGHPNTVWMSLNDTLGRVLGTFVIVDDAILSLFQTSDLAFHGQETLIQTEEYTYHCRGVLLRGQIFISSWAMTLTMEPKNVAPALFLEEELTDSL